jgi:hypothetical protein
MKRIIPTTALLALLAACGSDAESREDTGSEAALTEWASEYEAGQGDASAEGMSDAMGSGAAAGATSSTAATATAPRRTTGTAASGGTPPTTAQTGGDASTTAGGTQATAEPPTPPETPIRRIPAGAVLTFEVQGDVSTASAQAGTTFNLVLVEAVMGEGDAMLSAGTRAMGVVTEARRSTGPDEESLLAVRVSSVELRGAQTAISGEVVSTQVESSTRASGTRTAATVATGSAAGAMIGRILGRDTRSTVTGAAVGTAVGVAVALTSRGGDAVLASGSRVVVRLDTDLVY